MTTINDLPDEMLIEIFSYIHVQERQRLVTVCKRWELVIESMWRTINKLIIKIVAERSPYGEWEGAKCANIWCKRISDIVKVLRKFNRTLTKLDLEYNIHAFYSLSQRTKEIHQLLKEIQMKKQLTSVRLGPYSYVNSQYSFLRYLRMENLQHVSLHLPRHCGLQERVRAFELLLKATSLKYLYLSTYQQWMYDVLHKIDTLESLHIDHPKSNGRRRPPLCLSQFPNLKELTIHRHQLTHNEFFHTFGTTPNSLRALEISLPHHRFLSQDAFECIINLKNLTYLSLKLEEELDIQILSKLPKLEQLYINFDYKIEMPRHEISQLESILVKMPQLKKCWFYNDEFHEALKSTNHINENQLQKPEELSWIVWKRIFCFPQNHSKEKCCLYN